MQFKLLPALLLSAVTLNLQACAEDDAAAADAGTSVDAAVEATYTCNVNTRQTVPDQPVEAYACAGEPAFTTIDDQGHVFDIFTYEASHPLANDALAFPCASYIDDTDGVATNIDMRAPAVPTEPCSTAGVRPWHTVEWDDADAACTRIGWRMCSGDELLRACAGEAGLAYTYGNSIEAGKCNIREAFRGDDGTGSEAPTGAFDECASPDGVHDVNGNVWEWTGDRLENDARARVYQGAGWKTIAQRHQDSEQTCEVTTRVTGFSAPSFASEYVGFRCCRDAN
jgi:hypothetical protein